MQTLVQKTEEDLNRSTQQWLEEKNRIAKISGLFLPAGNTLRPVYAAWRKAPPPELKDLHLLQMDEVLEGEKRGLFQRFFEQELPAHKVEMLGEHAFQGSTLSILGLGLNGHVAFHEPDMPRNFSFGEVRLSESSAKELGVPVGSLAKSYGLGAFMKSRALLLVVTGEKKREIFKRFMKRDPELPVTALHSHPDLTILVDEAAKG